jgi:hypothetical protein
MLTGLPLSIAEVCTKPRVDAISIVLPLVLWVGC